MPADRFDVVVLGGGVGGYPAAIRSSQLGLRTALIDAGALGGTCLHVGCIPTKALLESSDMFAKLRDKGTEFGVLATELKVDPAAIGARRDRVVDQLVKGVGGLLRKHKVEVITGRGVVKSANGIQVGDRLVETANLIIATGSVPRSLPGIEIDGKRIINSDHAVRANTVPGTVAIAGAGAIGVEFATYYRQMGAKVTVIEALDRLVPLEDEEVSAVMLKAFNRDGIECRLGARILEAKADDTGVTVKLESGELRVDQLLIAIGRAPVAKGFGLEEVGVTIDQRGFITVDEWMRTNVPGIHAIGDCVGGYLLAHAATHEGIIAAEDIAGKRIEPMHQELVTRCTYSHPQIASVGLTEREARERGVDVKVGKFPFAAIGRALIHGQTEGFVKYVVDAATGRLLGAHIVGVEATELIAEPALAMLFQGDAWEIGRNIHPHPTLSEALGEAAFAVDGMAIHF